MGNKEHLAELEKNVAKNIRRGRVEAIVLLSLKAAGLVSVTILAPNAVGALAKLGLIDTKKKHASLQTATRAVKRLRERDLIKQHDGSYSLTDKGRAALMRLEALHGAAIERPRVWDKKWRIVVFDVSEKKKKLRDRLRYILRSAGFEFLQNSVWVYPYRCDELIALLKVDLMLGSEMLYIVADEIEGDAPLKQHFGLL